MTSTSSLDDLDLALSQASDAEPKPSAPTRRPGVTRQPRGKRHNDSRDNEAIFVDVELALGTLLADRILARTPSLEDALRNSAPVVVIEVPSRDLIEPVHNGLSERIASHHDAEHQAAAARQ